MTGDTYEYRLVDGDGLHRIPVQWDDMPSDPVPLKVFVAGWSRLAYYEEHSDLVATYARSDDLADGREYLGHLKYSKRRFGGDGTFTISFEKVDWDADEFDHVYYETLPEGTTLEEALDAFLTEMGQRSNTATRNRSLVYDPDEPKAWEK